MIIKPIKVYKLAMSNFLSHDIGCCRLLSDCIEQSEQLRTFNYLKNKPSRSKHALVGITGLFNISVLKRVDLGETLLFATGHNLKDALSNAIRYDHEDLNCIGNYPPTVNEGYYITLLQIEL